MQFLDELLETIRGMIVSLIKQNEPTFCYGVVTAVNPIKIKVKDSYEVDEAFLILDSRCRHTVVKVPVDGGEKHIHEIDDSTEETSETGAFEGTIGGAPATGNITLKSHKHAIKINTKEALPEILLWRGLKVGDKVKILRLTGGSIHYVMERVERLDNPGEVDDSGSVKSQDNEENWS